MKPVKIKGFDWIVQYSIENDMKKAVKRYSKEYDSDDIIFLNHKDPNGNWIGGEIYLRKVPASKKDKKKSVWVKWFKSREGRVRLELFRYKLDGEGFLSLSRHKGNDRQAIELSLPKEEIKSIVGGLKRVLRPRI